MRLSLVTLGLLGAVASSAAAREMVPPRLVSAAVDWPAALGSLSPGAESSAALASRNGTRRPLRTPRALARLNAVMAQRFPDIARSPVPVLLPLDTTALLRDLDAGRALEGNERYLSGFQTSKFFYPGPSGYDAVFSLRTADVPELSDIKFANPIDIVISGSALLYELDDPTPATGAPVASLESEFPGIRRLIHEHHLRYTFVRFGVPYAVSTTCFHGSVSRMRMPTCQSADRILHRFLRSLRFAGGTPKPLRPAAPLAVERPSEASPTFTYHRPGRLLPGTGFRGHAGLADQTVYSQIRFPLADPPAFVNSQMFQKRNRALNSDQDASPNYSYPWRDNFCERRGFPVGQCPGGIGHQGQDIRTPPCPSGPAGEGCRAERHIVAVRDGMILRRPKQEAVYLFVNTGNEHLRFRYLHMSPRKMDDDNLLSGRRVHEGEVISQVGNFNNKEGGTSYHLHFDIQVPTRDGWVFVNPYMTLVASYERLIGGRGEPIAEPVAVAAADATGSTSSAASVPPAAAEPEKPQRAMAISKRKHAKHKKRKKVRLARR